MRDRLEHRLVAAMFAFTDWLRLRLAQRLSPGYNWKEN
jgi:hypothetical protein